MPKSSSDFVTALPVDGHVTKLAEGVYQIEGKISVAETAEVVAISHFFPFETVVWISPSPMAAPHQRQPTSGLSNEDLEQLLREADGQPSKS